MKRKILIDKYKKVLIDTINILDIHKLGRCNKFNHSVYIDYIFRILFYSENWNTFQCNLCDRSTIRKKFYKWRDLGIFKFAYDLMVSKYNKNRIIKKFFIDSTVIENYNCCDDLIDYYYKIKTKKQIKLSIITDHNNVVHSYEISNPKKHDSSFIKPLINKLKCNTNENSVLIADKGYTKKKKYYKHNNKNIKLIVPKKKNQRKYIKKENNNYLKERYKVEQTFSNIKRTYSRLRKLNERKLINYETFLIMAFTCQLIKYTN